MVSFKFLPVDCCCHGNEFWDKIDYNSAPVKDNCSLFAPTPYFRARAIRWCHLNFSPEDPCCHGNQLFLFKDKIGCRLTRASNAKMQLLGYRAWQWDRYFVPQNVFLVAYCLQSVPVKEFWKSVNNWRTYKQKQSGTFFIGPPCKCTGILYCAQRSCGLIKWMGQGPIFGQTDT